MSNIVVDSCVVVKCILAAEDSEQAEQLCTDTVSRREQLLVLDVALVEAANAVWKRHHRGLIDLMEARQFVRHLLTSSLQILPSPPLSNAAMEIATKPGRSVYDALFVALAADLHLPGVTADEPLWQVIHADFPNIVLLRDWR
jgi:predicted nucleic acid-binding protein